MTTNLSSLGPVFSRIDRLKAHRDSAKSDAAKSILAYRVYNWTRLARLFVNVLKDQNHSPNDTTV